MNKKLLFILIFIFSPSFLFGSQRSVALFEDEKSNPVYAENINKELIPASTVKVLTALIAVEKLGIDYQFSTKAFIDENNNLYIKGFGDPLFISEQIEKFCKNLAEITEKKEFNSLIIDQSFFSKSSINFQGTKKLSLNPYDSPNNALAANFNSVCFDKKQNKYISCEKETPFISEILFLVKKSGLKKGRIPVTNEKNSNLLYPAYLIKHFLKNENIKFKGKIKLLNNETNTDLTEILNYKSDYTLKEIIEKMLFYSNNFIANQLFLAIGADKNGADIKKSQIYYNNYLAKNNIFATIVEGSGISRENKISASEMIKILKKFKPYYFLMKKDGKGNFYKTGTLSDVKNLCGYYRDTKNKIFLYSIFQNKSSKNPFNEFSFLKEKIKKDL
jgi:D-alanyl-D-alanine carboxypeptidase/D-alanyl-D-alanine-endopeptidase (penicillin-binding protein 4)